jgi:hypothetical protein
MPEGHAVLAWGRAGEDVDAAHAARFGRTFRRTSRYVKLAQVGAAACMERFHVPGVDPARVGVFLGSGLGNTADIVPLSEGVLRLDRPWASPMAFAGSVGNAASFHVARMLGFTGPNVTVSQEELSFEGALVEAGLALDEHRVDHALVGGVDVRTGTDDQQRQRIDAEDVPGPIAEGAVFLLVARDGAGPALRASLGEPGLACAPATTRPGWRQAADVTRRLYPVEVGEQIVAELERPGAGAHLHFVHATRGGLSAAVCLRGTAP